MKTRLSGMVLCLLACVLGVQAAPVQLRSFVSWDYPKRERLSPWLSTERAIWQSLRQWEGGSTAPVRESGGQVAQLEAVFAGAPSPMQPRIVYIAAHQNEDGRLELVDGSHVRLRDYVGTLEAGTLLVVDACFAAAARVDRDAPEGVGVLYAAAQDEKTWEVRVVGRRPVDFSKRYPRAVRWLKRHMSKDWDGRISFLGLVWVEAFLQTPSQPQTQADWEAFFKQCERISHDFLQTRGAAQGSHVYGLF